MIQAPYDNVIVTITEKFYSSIKFDSGVMLWIDPKWDPSEHSMMEATVVSAPRAITDRMDFKGFSSEGIRPGDKILMRYDVVFAYASQPENDTAVFMNEMWYYQKSYWRADIRKVFCVIRGKKTIMLNDYIICDPIIENKSELYTDLIIRPESQRKVIRMDKAVVRHIGKNDLGVIPGDTVYFNQKYVQHYKINGKIAFILSHRHILGRD